jgi:type IV pilus assembly protein PilM
LKEGKDELFSKEQLVFRFCESTAELALLSKGLNSVNFRDTLSFSSAANTNNSDVIYNTEENITSIKKFIEKKKVKNKQAKVVLALDGIITRLIECPMLKKKDLKKFIHNNINEYFTLNMNDYYYDYKVLDIEKKDAKKITLLLVVFPKLKLDGVRNFITSCGLGVSQIDIYPDAIANTFYEKKGMNIAVFEVGLEKNNVTILEQGKIFLYSRMTSETYSDRWDSYVEILESMGYFLNFYSTRHFGNRVDKIYIIGQYWNDRTFYDMVKEQFGIETVAGIKLDKFKIYSRKNLDKNLYSDIIGSCIKTKSTYNKRLDFSKATEKKKDINVDSLPVKIAGVLAVITLLWVVLNFAFININMKKYDLTDINTEIKALASAESEVNELLRTKKVYDKKQEFITAIEKDRYNYLKYLEILKNGLPASISVKTVNINRDRLDVTFSMSGNALDKVNLVIAINKIGIFEPIEIGSISLSGKETEASLTLRIKKPL